MMIPMWKVPLFDAAFDETDVAAVADVLRSGWLTMGEVTQEFERRFADFLGVRHAVAVSSGTAALHLANLALNVGPGDEVICPALTFVAAANSIAYCGARPVFADLTSLDDLSVSPAQVESQITSRTKAIQVVHYAGHPCDMDALAEIAERHGLPLIEDAAHAPGAELGGRRCGSLGRLGCFSFFSNKNMTTAEGGMVATDDDELAGRVRLLRSHGMTSVTLDRHRGRATSYDVVGLGHNYRIDELRSALGLRQLAAIEERNRQRAEAAEWYRERLAPVEGMSLPGFGSRGVPSHHILPAVLGADIDREAFMAGMKERGIQTSIHYPPIHLFSHYRQRYGCSEGQLPVTAEAGRREVTLPLFPGMDEPMVELVCSAVVEALADSPSA